MRITQLALASLFAFGLSLSTTPASAAPQKQSAKKDSKYDVPSADALSHYYKLAADSSHVQGCFPPCLCPVQLRDDFRGSFELHLLPTLDPVFNSYEVRNVNWLVGSGASEVRIVGEGIYRVAPGLGQHRMTLDLVLNDGAPTQFDSGLVTGGGVGLLPKIEIAVNMNDLNCFDTVLQIKAAPQLKSRLRSFAIDSGSFQEGCLPPCLCPINQAQPVSGEFKLLPLGRGPLGTIEFAVVDVQWAVHPPQPSPLPAFTPVSGQGIYQLALFSTTPVSTHRMLLELDVGGTEDNWDSGTVPETSHFPVIDIALGINDFMCFERVFAIQASPK